MEIELGSVVDRVRGMSMASEIDIGFTCEQVLGVIEREVPGVLVECGVWRGGCSAAMLLAQIEAYGRVRREAFLLDSFEGLPPATGRDGPLALAWQTDTTSPAFMDNCRAGLDEVRAGLSAVLPEEGWELVPGWFEDTVPTLARRLHGQGIAVLRLDGDWYDSTMVCLEHLVPLVSEEGIILIDDYYAWDGCARAVHDYLSRHDLAYRIREIHGGIGAYMIKRAARADSSTLHAA
jgi:O-methyltransferase